MSLLFGLELAPVITVANRVCWVKAESLTGELRFGFGDTMALDWSPGGVWNRMVLLRALFAAAKLVTRRKSVSWRSGRK